MFEIVALRDGLHTVRDLLTGETFHPVVGPMVEAHAIHVGPLRMAERMSHTGTFTLWDVGFGAAANAVAVLETLQHIHRPFRCEMISFDSTVAPIGFALEHAEKLSYPLPWLKDLRHLLSAGQTTITFPEGGELAWRLHLEDFTRIAGQPAPDGVIYDPYSPVKNPAMWSLAHFARLRPQMTRPALLTSYSRSTAVRVTLLLAGFFVGIGGATGEKDQTTLAATRLDLLEQPLGQDWLKRVRASTSARPLGTGGPGPILQEDLARLEAHPQFGADAKPEAGQVPGSA